MEFTRLADVEVVETATEADKVLIEQNGEIKRVHKTEVGGAGGKVLIFDVEFDQDGGFVAGAANMSLEDAIASFTNRTLTLTVGYTHNDSMEMIEPYIVTDCTKMMGAPSVMLMGLNSTIECLWTADGISTMS